MSEHKWKSGDRAIDSFGGSPEPCTIISRDEKQGRYIVRFNNERYGCYRDCNDSLGIASEGFLHPRTVEQITQEAVDDYKVAARSLFDCNCQSDTVICDDCDDNALAAIILAAIEEASDV